MVKVSCGPQLKNATLILACNPAIWEPGQRTWRKCMMKRMAKSIWSVSVCSLGVGLGVLVSAIPTLAAPELERVKQFGLISTCDFVNPNRLQCNFPATSRTAQIQYVSMQCGSTGGKISLDLFQLLAVPPNNTTLELAYQIPITNQTSLGGGDIGNTVSAGSSGPITRLILGGAVRRLAGL
jgi:hypothetical protein